MEKFIIQINGVDLETLGLENREPQVDVSPLIHNRKTLNTTAIYNHPKTSVKVKKGDIVTYTIRVYNEGEMAGYAKKVEDILNLGDDVLVECIKVDDKNRVDFKLISKC